MRVHHIETGGVVGDPRQHHAVGKQRITIARIETQRSGRASFQHRIGDRITGGEQGDLMPHLDEVFSQLGYHPFGAAVELGRHGLRKRRHLRDPHGSCSTSQTN
jgi:hypothetical protein